MCVAAAAASASAKAERGSPALAVIGQFAHHLSTRNRSGIARMFSDRDALVYDPHGESLTVSAWLAARFDGMSSSDAQVVHSWLLPSPATTNATAATSAVAKLSWRWTRVADAVPNEIRENDFEMDRWREGEHGATFTAIFQFAAAPKRRSPKITTLELYENAFLAPPECVACARRQELLHPKDERRHTLAWTQSLGVALHRCQEQLTACRIDHGMEVDDGDQIVPHQEEEQLNEEQPQQQAHARRQTQIDGLSRGTWERVDGAGNSGDDDESYDFRPSPGNGLRSFDRASALACLENARVVVVGDSTTRFFYAALLSLLRGHDQVWPKDQPLFWLPKSDPCSFYTAGWASGQGCSKDVCCRRWRGRCHGGRAAATCAPPIAVGATDLRFVWWTKAEPEERHGHTYAALATLARPPDGRDGRRVVLVAGLGLWDLLFTSPDARANRTDAALLCERVGFFLENAQRHVGSTDATPPVFLGLSTCPHANEYFPKWRGWPHGPVRKRVAAVGDSLATCVANASSWLYLDRRLTQAEAPKMWTSACHHHHAHGKLSSLHVQIWLNSVCSGKGQQGAKI